MADNPQWAGTMFRSLPTVITLLYLPRLPLITGGVLSPIAILFSPYIHIYNYLLLENFLKKSAASDTSSFS